MWTIYADVSNNNSFEYQASVVDATYNIENSNTGVQCNYTSSNSENIFFSYSVTMSNNVFNSWRVINSKNVKDSILVYDSENVLDSIGIFN